MATDELSEPTNHLVHDPERVLKVVNLMAHELRGPTSVIRGHLSMWLDSSLGELPPEFRDSLRMAYGKTVQLTNLIEQLLLAVRLDSGALDTSPGRTDLSVWLRELSRPQNERSPGVIRHESDRAHRMAEVWEKGIDASPMRQSPPSVL